MDGVWVIIPSCGMSVNICKEVGLPGKPDPPLIVEKARDAIGEDFPWIDCREVKHLGSGWDFDAFLADRWVFRFPRRAYAEALLARERPVHALVSSALPAGVSVPRVELVGEPTTGFPYRFAGHRYIEGAPADALPRSLYGPLAPGLADALAAIHSIPVGAARAAGVAELDTTEAGRVQWFEERLVLARSLRGLDPALDDSLDWLDGVADPLRRFDGPVRFIHHDLSPEHLLVDPATGELTGILDWTDTVLGDPARDFVTFVAFAGWEFTEEVLARYPLPLDPGFRDRLGFMARLLSLMWLAESHGQGEDPEKHTSWVQRAFAQRGQGDDRG